MNLLEHYIEKVLEIEDLTNKYQDIYGYNIFVDDIKEPVYKIKMIVNCYGRKETVEVVWLKSEYDTNIKRGYFLA